MLIACDNIISFEDIERLESYGFKTVKWAGQEHDELWFREGIEKGAEVFVSPDYDIGILCNHYNKRWLQIPSGVSRVERYHFVLNNLRKFTRRNENGSSK